jgi:hypothetical protein
MFLRKFDSSTSLHGVPTQDIAELVILHISHAHKGAGSFNVKHNIFVGSHNIYEEDASFLCRIEDGPAMCLIQVLRNNAPNTRILR